jgi:hypothetical protein
MNNTKKKTVLFSKKCFRFLFSFLSDHREIVARISTSDAIDWSLELQRALDLLDERVERIVLVLIKHELARARVVADSEIDDALAVLEARQRERTRLLHREADQIIAMFFQQKFRFFRLHSRMEHRKLEHAIHLPHRSARACATNK